MTWPDSGQVLVPLSAVSGYRASGNRIVTVIIKIRDAKQLLTFCVFNLNKNHEKFYLHSCSVLLVLLLSVDSCNRMKINVVINKTLYFSSKVQGKRFVYKFVCDLKQVIGYSAKELNTLVIEAEQKSCGSITIYKWKLQCAMSHSVAIWPMNCDKDQFSCAILTVRFRNDLTD